MKRNHKIKILDFQKKENIMSYEQKLLDMGFTIEPVKLDNGRFVEAVQVGNLIFTSGQIPIWNEKEIKGKVGEDLKVEEAYEAARMCTLNGLRAIKTVIGSLDRIVRIVKIVGMVNVAPGFDNTPGVVNGCSDLIREVFGAAGLHARSAIGMTIPFNYAVEVEMVVEVLPDN